MSVYEDLQEQLDEVHLYDGYFMCLCPKHDDHRPSMLVSETNQRFHCMSASCGFNGTLDYLLHYLTGKPYIPKLHVRVPVVLPQWRSWVERFGDEAGIAAAGHGLAMRNKELQSFFVKRKINAFMEEGMFGWMDGWHLFPVLNEQGQVIDIVCRGTKGTAKYVLLKKEEERTLPPLYVPNWERVLASDVCYVVYGIIDSWALESIGLPVVTGTTGKSLHADLLRPLKKEFIIVPDFKEDKDAWRLKVELGYPSEVKLLRYPYATKDPDEIRTKIGADALYQLLGVEHGNNISGSESGSGEEQVMAGHFGDRAGAGSGGTYPEQPAHS